MNQRTNEADIAAVTETVRAYYDGMMAGDEARLGRAFHPRACIVGNEGGELYWATLDEFIADREGVHLFAIWWGEDGGQIITGAHSPHGIPGRFQPKKARKQ